MARNSDKIQLPTNSTDIATIARYLKGIEKEGKVNEKKAKEIYKEVKATGKRKKGGATDSHTTGTLRKYGLIEDVSKTLFSISELGMELIKNYDEEGNPIVDEDEIISINLKIFASWHETTKGRDIHPGMIILKLLCDEDTGFYITEHEVAFFTAEPRFKSDSQYEEIKKYILEFREKYDGIYAGTSSPCKAEIFLPTFVNNWKILEKQCIYTVAINPENEGKFIFSELEGRRSKKKLDGTEEVDEVEDDEVTSGEETDGEEEIDESEEIDSTAEAYNFLNYVGVNIKDGEFYDLKTEYILSEHARFICGMQIKCTMSVEQIVYFGAPGTGKSYGIDKKLEKETVSDAYRCRVIFYPEYGYSDFVGSIKPKRDATGIDYSFVPGPFTQLLRSAFENPFKKHYLVIEEINRGSAAAIFGDLFQLLDRDSTGKSKYKIKNTDICTELCRSKKLEKYFVDGNMWFPSNLNILCTMNTADQNVFILDSAFKRRFHMEYIPISFESILSDANLKGYVEETKVFEGSTDLVVMFKNSEISDVVIELQSTGNLKRNWPTFAILANALIDSVNRNEGEQISEDKKLGAFYVLEDELHDKKMFSDKVLYYLKQDVFKYIDTYFNSSYQKLYDSYTAKGLDVFSVLLSGDE